MSRINRTPRMAVNADMAAFFDQLARQINGLSEGRISSRYSARTAAPTTETWAKGDFVANSSPTQLGSAGNEYFVDGWKCIVGGTPGTWVESRCMTADVSGGGGGGSVSFTAVTLTGVPYNTQSADVAVVDALITPSTKIMVGWGNFTNADENTPDMDDVSFTAIPGSGSMVVRLCANSPLSRLGGTYKINYLLG